MQAKQQLQEAADNEVELNQQVAALQQAETAAEAVQNRQSIGHAAV